MRLTLKILLMLYTSDIFVHLTAVFGVFFDVFLLLSSTDGVFLSLQGAVDL